MGCGPTFCACALAASMLSCFTAAEHALSTNWNTNSNGVFTTPANWENGARGAGILGASFQTDSMLIENTVSNQTTLTTKLPVTAGP
jgi:hypothetical protein